MENRPSALSRRRRWLRLFVFVLLILVLIKAVTTGLAVFELNSAVKNLQTVPADAAQFEENVERVFLASGRMIAEIKPFVPVIQLAGTDGCALAELITIASSLSPIGLNLSPVAAGAYESYMQSGEQRIWIAPLRERWNVENASRLAVQVQQMQRRPRCLAENGRLRAWQEAADGLLVLSELFLTTPWDSVLADGSTSLIVLNNSDELRATGGFTTALIVIEVQDGYLNWRLMNSYNVDDETRYAYHPPAPAPQQRYMALSKWTFRDANWSPDHRESAETALRLYALDQQVPMPQNLITVNFTALRTLMNYAPPLQVSEATLNAENIMDVVREAWGFDSSLSSFDPNRKNFLQDLAWEIASALAEQLSPVEQARLGLAMQDMLLRRDVMIYTTIPAWRDWLAAKGWDGALINETGDYVMVVDSNFGYNKMTLYSKQSIRYAVDLRETPQSRLTLHYVNNVESNLDCTQYTRIAPEIEAEGREPNYYDRAVNCYWNYIRVLTPPASQIQDYLAWATPPEWFPLSRAANPAQIDALQVGPYNGFGTMLVVPIQDEREVWFKYSLPPHMIQRDGTRNRYTLYLQKQPGAPPADLTIEITLPANASLLSSDPDDFQVMKDNQLVLERSFETDIAIEIVYE